MLLEGLFGMHFYVLMIVKVDSNDKTSGLTIDYIYTVTHKQVIKQNFQSMDELASNVKSILAFDITNPNIFQVRHTYIQSSNANAHVLLNF